MSNIQIPYDKIYTINEEEYKLYSWDTENKPSFTLLRLSDRKPLHLDWDAFVKLMKDHKYV